MGAQLLSFVCPEKLEDMSPTDGGSFCDRCQKRVRDLSQLAPEEAAETVRSAKNGACVSYSLIPGRRLAFRGPRPGTLAVVSVAAFLAACGRSPEAERKEPAREVSLTADPAPEAQRPPSSGTPAARQEAKEVLRERAAETSCPEPGTPTQASPPRPSASPQGVSSSSKWPSARETTVQDPPPRATPPPKPKPKPSVPVQVITGLLPDPRSRILGAAG